MKRPKNLDDHYNKFSIGLNAYFAAYSVYSLNGQYVSLDAAAVYLQIAATLASMRVRRGNSVDMALALQSIEAAMAVQTAVLARDARKGDGYKVAASCATLISNGLQIAGAFVAFIGTKKGLGTIINMLGDSSSMVAYIMSHQDGSESLASRVLSGQMEKISGYISDIDIDGMFDGLFKYKVDSSKDIDWYETVKGILDFVSDFCPAAAVAKAFSEMFFRPEINSSFLLSYMSKPGVIIDAISENMGHIHDDVAQMGEALARIGAHCVKAVEVLSHGMGEGDSDAASGEVEDDGVEEGGVRADAEPTVKQDMGPTGNSLAAPDKIKPDFGAGVPEQSPKVDVPKLPLGPTGAANGSKAKPRSAENKQNSQSSAKKQNPQGKTKDGHRGAGNALVPSPPSSAPSGSASPGFTPDGLGPSGSAPIDPRRSVPGRGGKGAAPASPLGDYPQPVTTVADASGALSASPHPLYAMMGEGGDDVQALVGQANQVMGDADSVPAMMSMAEVTAGSAAPRQGASRSVGSGSRVGGGSRAGTGGG